MELANAQSKLAHADEVFKHKQAQLEITHDRIEQQNLSINLKNSQLEEKEETIRLQTEFIKLAIEKDPSMK